MRRIVLIGLAGALAGCATHTPPPRGPGGPMASGHKGEGGSRERGPEHGPDHGRGQLFVSPMGEPFRASQRPGAAQEQWFAGADADADGRITEAEFQRDAARFFAVLDRGKDGEIDPDDIAYYENTLVPEIRVGGSGGGSSRGSGGRGPRGNGGPPGGGSGGRSGGPGGGSGGGSGGPGMKFGGDDKASGAAVRERLGAARYGFFDLPEPVAAADRNLNRGIDATEFAKAAATRFAALDKNHDGALTRGELPRAGAETWRNGSDRPPPPPRETAEPSPAPSTTP
ncbi:EF-hand domain-containing protein [Sphingomonas sp. 4RDLI-65]|uniref:EF-hand domain-containing protein n=1 Tax=Sphingomonas sp. 4RDLI-65 TaxID=3111641 RepID=UPI003C244058